MQLCWFIYMAAWYTDATKLLSFCEIGRQVQFSSRHHFPRSSRPALPSAAVQLAQTAAACGQTLALDNPRLGRLGYQQGE